MTAIRFLQVNEGPPYLISGSADAYICLWYPHIGSDNILDYRLKHSRKAHSASITCLSCTCQINAFFVSGSADSTIVTWEVIPDSVGYELVPVQIIRPSQALIPLCLALHLLSNNRVILAAGGTRPGILLFCSSRPNPFAFQAMLHGHEGWIRALDFAQNTSPSIADQSSGFRADDILLASASQDKYVRLWRIHPYFEKVDEAIDAETGPSHDVDFDMSNRLYRLSFSDAVYLAMFEALLVGHDDWIYTATWAFRDQKPYLLTASADNSLAIWSADEQSGIWVTDDRLGELSIQKGSTSATGSVGGLWNGLWGPDGRTIVGLGRIGSWQKWRLSQETNTWTQEIGVTGHTKPVRAVSWTENGAFLLSVSADRTARLHAEWIRSEASSWHEFSRPQIHGYDLNCVEAIGSNSFVSGADEKLLRVFEEPDDLAANLQRFCQVPTPKNRSIKSAGVPVLGLSNKAEGKLGESDNEQRSFGALSEFEPTGSCQRLPHEDHLAKSSLWPEKEKLYGHGFEIQSVAVSRDQTLIATSCKASSLEHAVIRLFSTCDWRQIENPLRAHSLTVTGLEFSTDSSLLLSIGRDRQWVVWSRNCTEGIGFSMSGCEVKAHPRMILSACWLANVAVGAGFVTGGREKTIKLWSKVGTAFVCRSSLEMCAAPVALESGPVDGGEHCLIACGLENGEVHLLKYTHKQEVITMFRAVPSR